MDWKKRNMFSSAVDMQRGGAVPWPGYLYGGLTGDPIMPTQLFEEGDQDINMALNKKVNKDIKKKRNKNIAKKI